jgi:hypothetical protein
LWERRYAQLHGTPSDHYDKQKNYFLGSLGIQCI